MKIRYIITRMDLLQGRMLAIFSNRILGGFYLLLAAYVVFRSLHEKSVLEQGVAFRCILVGIELFFLFGGSFALLIVISAIQVFATKGKGQIGEHSLRITEEGLEESTEYNIALNRWSGFHRMKKRGSIYLLYVTENSAHVVPTKRAPLEGDFAAFFREIEARSGKSSQLARLAPGESIHR
jgi:hypothetical protein